jgi:hypothetical protein
MITRQDAEGIAADWARTESDRRGYDCTPMLAEFDLGFVVWTKQPSEVLPIPGDGVKSVIDRDTGRVSTWPGVPSDAVAEMYRRHRGQIVDPPRTVDPEVELRRNARRAPSPAVAAHLTIDGRLFIARGAKGDQVLRHHPLVQQYLAGLPAGHLVRGGERHAELIVLSDVLHEADRVRLENGGSPVTLDEARQWLVDARLETFHIRERYDPLGGEPAEPCESCTVALVDFALLEWPKLARVETWQHGSPRIAEPGRFPDDVGGYLAYGGWTPMDDVVRAGLAAEMIRETVKTRSGRHRHAEFPAVRQAFTDFPGVCSGRRGPGVQRWIRLFDIEPVKAKHTADMLAEFGAVIGARLFPLGIEDKGDAILAMDDNGRVFALDQGGEWFLGDTMDAAVLSLITGDGPAERVRDDGTW